MPSRSVRREDVPGGRERYEPRPPDQGLKSPTRPSRTLSPTVVSPFRGLASALRDPQTHQTSARHSALERRGDETTGTRVRPGSADALPMSRRASAQNSSSPGQLRERPLGATWTVPKNVGFSSCAKRLPFAITGRKSTRTRSPSAKVSSRCLSNGSAEMILCTLYSSSQGGIWFRGLPLRARSQFSSSSSR